MFVRSDNLGNLTPFGRQALIDYGVTTVLDLRSESEVEGSPSPFATREARGPVLCLNLPLIDDLTAPRLAELPGIQDTYLGMLDQRQGAIGAIFTAMAAAEGGVVFHCFAGKDRTGLIAAMVLAVAGVEARAIAADFAETDVHLAARYQQWLAAAPPERRERMRTDLQCPPERIQAVLDHLERRWGGVESYMEAAGVAPSAISRLGAKLRRS